MLQVHTPPNEREMLALLRRVSRSFYLSVRLLPPPLRRPVAVGYLLARTSDSIADAPGLDAEHRLQMLQQFDDDVQGRCPPSPIPAPASMPQAEAQLLGAFVNCIAWLQSLPPDDRADVLTVLGHITRGQKLDVERFGDATSAEPQSLATDEELDEYTYLVAGCVGEFWTKLGFRHVPGYSSLQQDEMMSLGRRYGMALQLINVLRDASDDLVQGRCYVLDPANLAPWLARAREGLECGMRYSLSLPSARIRVASALPALIGARTLALMQRSPRSKRVKMPRSEVRGLIARIALSLGSRARLDYEFLRATAGWENPPR